MIQKGNVGKSVGKVPEEQVKEEEFRTSEEIRVANGTIFSRQGFGSLPLLPLCDVICRRSQQSSPYWVMEKL